MKKLNVMCREIIIIGLIKVRFAVFFFLEDLILVLCMYVYTKDEALILCFYQEILFKSFLVC